MLTYCKNDSGSHLLHKKRSNLVIFIGTRIFWLDSVINSVLLWFSGERRAGKGVKADVFILFHC